MLFVVCCLFVVVCSVVSPSCAVFHIGYLMFVCFVVIGCLTFFLNPLNRIVEFATILFYFRAWFLPVVMPAMMFDLLKQVLFETKKTTFLFVVFCFVFLLYSKIKSIFCL